MVKRKAKSAFCSRLTICCWVFWSLTLCASDKEADLDRSADITSQYKASIISETLAALIKQASKSGYSVHILSKHTENSFRVVILLGEKHCLNFCGTNEAGRALVDCVPLRGVEGYTPNSIVSKAFCYCLAPLMFCCSAFNAMKCGSMTNYAYESSKEKLNLVEAGNLDPKVVGLEEGHKADVAEDLAMLTIFVSAAGAVAVPIVWVYAPHAAKYVAYAVAALGSYIMSGIIAGPLLEKFLPKSWPTGWTRWLGYYGLAVHRNETMVDNIELAFDTHPEYDKLLSIVGMSHLPGMIKLLVKEKGYTEIDF
ncbi:MAG TPA: hypothetical protein VEL47_05640 [Myxococcota bacterium]|nr:hypothetical protein [Myxococcota bacterium]